MEQMKKLFELEEYCNESNPMTFNAYVERPDINSLYGKIKCAYFESGVDFFEKNKKQPTMWKSFFCSEKIFYLIPEKTNKMIKIDPSPALQLFIGPTFEKKFTKKNAPKEYLEDFEDEISKFAFGRLLDYCLVKEDRYFVNLKTEEYEAGPPDRQTGLRRTSTVTFVQISNLPFKNGKPQLPQTPANKNAIFG